MRKRSRRAGSGSHDVSDEVVTVRRSSIAACVTCGLCGCFLRDTTAISECLHAFCRECIVDEITHKNIDQCPKCSIDLGGDPLAKLRSDHSLQRISSVMFPAKRKMEELSSMHPELVSLPSLTSQANETYHSGYKMDVHLVGDPLNTVDTAAEGRTASPATSQSEEEKNTARILEMIEVYIGQTHAAETKTARRRETYHSHQLRSAMFPDICLVAEPVGSETETKENERLGMESFASLEALGHSQLTTSDGIQSQVYKDFARLNEELENAMAFERARVLEERLKKQTERLQIEFNRSQEAEAAQREALRENGILKQEIAKKNEELINLKNNFTMIEKRSTQVEQRNTFLQDQIDHINRLLEAEKSNTGELSEQLGKAVNEKNKLMTELETNNDGLAKIQGCIHKSLTARISQLKGIAATTNLGHYQHLLARMDALGQVKEHLPKMFETIEVATSLLHTAWLLPCSYGFVHIMEMTSIFKGLLCLCISMGETMLRFEIQLTPWQQKLHGNMEFVNIDVQRISHDLQACLVGSWNLCFVSCHRSLRHLSFGSVGHSCY